MDGPEMTEESVIIWGGRSGWADRATQRAFLDCIFRDEGFTGLVLEQIEKADLSIQGSSDILGLCQQFIDALKASGDKEMATRAQAHERSLQLFIQHSQWVTQVYHKGNKPDSHAVFWPNPERDGGMDLRDILPFVHRHPILEKDTPLGTAGSCFAFELSHAMQRKGYNYVVTEPVPDGSDGVWADVGREGGELVDFCAHWGLLFNAPSFAQLAERAFGERDFGKKLIREDGPGGQKFFSDPYREGVFFADPESYLADLKRHIPAVRRALEECKVFTITPGLNECWQFLDDGTYFSRNPRGWAAQVMAKPRVLTVEENITALQRFIDIVRHHNRDIKFIISLSPIPFLATWRAQDHHVVSANSHSKAVLRVAVEEVVARNKDCFYFPSYELITACLEAPWTGDRRHVTREAVDRVMEMFNQMFVIGA
ncbi:GSCFA domain-containing protein [Aestuariispira insulae]|uniref:GSCFA family protein n=1 Tax=Aestuariispira insulae TaxID=1461337 RepID=A0A3D9HAD5_9PROT|nr:GSCFA domain-containing protein [Aestuariispira insulae]RED46141.1 GSCFA family protein [Aestuariispira insulae]